MNNYENISLHVCFESSREGEQYRARENDVVIGGIENGQI